MCGSYLNAQAVGPIGMSEEKDADELEAEKDMDLPPLPPIPLQQEPSSGIPRRRQRPAGDWCATNGVVPPPGSFSGVAAENTPRRVAASARVPSPARAPYANALEG